MKIKVWTFAEDADSGTRATVFGSEAELHAHLKQIMLDAYGDDIETVDGKYRFTPCGEGESNSAHDIRALEWINDGDIIQAFEAWREGNYHEPMDTFNWDMEEVEVALPTTKAKIFFLKPDGDGEDIEFFQTKAALEAAMRAKILAYIGETPPAGRREVDWKEEIRALLANGDSESVHDAWYTWNENLALDDTTWSEGEEEIEIPNHDAPLVDLLSRVLKVINMTNPEHATFRDSGAAAIQDLCALEAEIRSAVVGKPAESRAMQLLRIVDNEAREEEWCNPGMSAIDNDVLDKVGALVAEVDQREIDANRENSKA